MEKAFKMIDKVCKKLKTINLVFKDKNGLISTKELNQVFKTLNIEEKYWKNLIKDIDQNGDGEVIMRKIFKFIFILDFFKRIH